MSINMLLVLDAYYFKVFAGHIPYYSYLKRAYGFV